MPGGCSPSRAHLVASPCDPSAALGCAARRGSAVGAPAELLDAAHEAARDEVRHAALCFGSDAAVRSALAGIADDEARHAARR
ncbi:hypothetical protein WMF37_00970 [Sorangium sp. So ce291]|uniref:hypothetical protein n=1 Tax=Sorangium sp. So ce291 TaxID=3133294 RepID=UPI003F622160